MPNDITLSDFIKQLRKDVAEEQKKLDDKMRR